MTAPHVILVILSSIIIFSNAQSLYSRACSGGDPAPNCKKYCELCQTGCLPPGKTLATKTFFDVCNEEQKLQFEKERDEVTKICQDYLDGLIDNTSSDPADKKNINNDIDNIDDQSKHEDGLGTSTQNIDDVYAKCKTTNTILTAIIGLQFIIIVSLISQLRSKRDQKPGPTKDQKVSELKNTEAQPQHKGYEMQHKHEQPQNDNNIQPQVSEPRHPSSEIEDK